VRGERTVGRKAIGDRPLEDAGRKGPQLAEPPALLHRPVGERREAARRLVRSEERGAQRVLSGLRTEVPGGERRERREADVGRRSIERLAGREVVQERRTAAPAGQIDPYGVRRIEGTRRRPTVDGFRERGEQSTPDAHEAAAAGAPFPRRRRRHPLALAALRQERVVRVDARFDLADGPRYDFAGERDQFVR